MLKSAVAGVVLGLATLTMSSPASAGLAPTGGITIDFNALGDNNICHSLTGEVNYEWEEGSPGGTCPEDSFEGRARGGVIAPFTGSVIFCGSHDDGMELSVNGEVIFSSLFDQGFADPCNTTDEVTMVEGECYPLEIYFYENGGNAGLRLQWAWDGGDYEVIPASAYDDSCANRVNFDFDVRGLLPRTNETLPKTGSNLAVPLTLGVVFLGLGLVLVRRRGAIPVR